MLCRKRFWFWLILLAAVAVRLYGITNPLLDNHAWRQADTASMAANFLQSGFYPPWPQLDYDGPPPNFAELEFPLLPLLTAAAWKLFGQSDVIARGWAVLFSSGTLVMIYLLGRELYDRKSGLLAMAFFGLNPMAIYYGRSVLPDGPMLFFMTAAVYFMVRWLRNQFSWEFILASLCFALAVLSKLPALIAAVPLLALGYQKHGPNVVKTRNFWLFMLIGFVPPLIYYLSAHYFSSTQYVSGILQLQGTLRPDMEYLRKRLEGMVTAPLLIIALSAPFLRRARGGNLFLWSWLAILAVYTLSVGAKIQLEYYLLPLLPPLCVLAGGALGYFWGETPGIISILLIFGLCLHTAGKSLEHYYDFNAGLITQAGLVEKATKPGDLIIISDERPMLFYYSHRKGWRLLPGRQTPQSVEKMHQEGAKLFVIVPGQAPNPALISYLAARYRFFPEGDFYLL